MINRLPAIVPPPLVTMSSTGGAILPVLDLRHFEGPASQWGKAAGELTQWTRNHLVNRTDVFGKYLPKSRRTPGHSNNYTAPVNRSDRTPGALNDCVLGRHFVGHDEGDVIGLHAIAIDNTSRWCTVDIDRHDESDPTTPEVNFAAACGWYGKLVGLGFRPLLFDSNGAGGFHLSTIFSEPVPSERVFDFGHWLVQDFAEYDLCQKPEVFPKQPNVNPSRPYGSWCRLFGRHHTRPHWTKVWDGTAWLEGRPAIDLILAVAGDLPSLIPSDLTGSTEMSTGSRHTVAQPNNRQCPPSPYGTEHWLEILGGCSPGGRHEALLKLAGHLLGKGVAPRVVEELCVVWNEARNMPPREQNHIRQTVQDLVKRAQSTERRHQGRHSGLVTFRVSP
jgi:hypothetical protein